MGGSVDLGDWLHNTYQDGLPARSLSPVQILMQQYTPGSRTHNPDPVDHKPGALTITLPKYLCSVMVSCTTLLCHTVRHNGPIYFDFMFADICLKIFVHASRLPLLLLHSPIWVA